MSTESTSLPFRPPKRIRKRISNFVFGTKYAIDLTPGDHVYAYSKSNLYTHHGIVDADGYIIHNVGDRDSYKKCRYTNDGRCPTKYGNRKCGILKSCIECFKGERQLHKYRYGIKNYNPWRPADGGTTTELEKDPDPKEILKRARDSLENNNQEYELQYNNCEDFAVYCSTGQTRQSKQSRRLRFFMPFIKLVPLSNRKIKNIRNH
ncbi:hypothetical protein MPTK1_3g10470 [Marchantia polymorpha subsp. ruderalis]|uniref:LRAT domain-containing protein n=2 Tax=Marchantia polymorpha TaxID=3197 RepID=A0AAF6AZD5_MARPO|nr:hypothetical protein MARPO_0037s0149 [Marchantia polymorpha]BBN05118.1 hypothetical protein Mp_3g10470 [Marchantia polymorpha subsp. ruderalis]PTQ40986.1 hypothetical protein MARPO_0037s0149 [Marchantia polymorpha]PTQ40987.1 hypothetical protein MARPO_0037s0149 [Marchantia polymorpha]BBN05119.1 hypothetical protein Mp_3g10470 [Marchantia polymorpha subsp. ruderalis]|eukprot:PTQ40985.1 hypothetical protein MARPO_0037s0149 [Marchantia polymorpha]